MESPTVIALNNFHVNPFISGPTNTIQPEPVSQFASESHCKKISFRLIFVYSNVIAPTRGQKLNFQDLHELLRQELLRRIEQGALTGTLLARQAGFQQAHVSNYLNRKRALSLEGLDRMLASQNLTIEQILPLELTSVAAKVAGDTVEVVPVVSPSVAMEESRIPASSVIETLQVSATRLRDHRARPNQLKINWQRFVAIRTDSQQTAAMEPLIQPGSIVILDRHYNSLAPYRAHKPSVYAVRTGGTLLIRFVELDDARLILRPNSMDFPVQLVQLRPKESPSDYIVGRVCMVFAEF